MKNALRLLPVVLFTCLGSTFSAADESEGIEFFEKKIRPVLVKHCYECHSTKENKAKGGLVLDTRAGIRMGGESGHAVVPGDIEGSELIAALRYESFEMPPKSPLPDEVIDDFVKWIEMGAPDPRDGKTGLIRRVIDFEEGRRHWAFQPPVKADMPDVKNDAWPRDELDKHVLKGLETRGLTEVDDAERGVLLRRLYFDLIGLPPTPEQRVAFLADTSSTAVETVVDELLASPHFGERWGRHWLDVARYAESNGRERNYLFPHAWRYRDYVIASFNSDKPYDEFIREQIAGDLLPAESDAERDEKLVATGFLAIGPKLLNERNPEIFAMDMIDDQIDVTTRAVMALTVSCARCHDHKFDPIPTAEYYALAGIFRSSKTFFTNGGGRGSRQSSGLMPLKSIDSSEQEKQRELYDDKLKAMRDELQNAQKELKRLRGGSGKKKARKKKNAKGGQEPEDSSKAVDPKSANKRMNSLRADVKKLTKQIQTLQEEAPPAGPVAMGIQEGKIADIAVCIRGEATERGDVVKRGYLTILSEEAPPLVESKQSGRLELAHWITDRNNPLTARVAVNRIWQHLFGQGLVRSVDNFGTTGEEPTHPELLDLLALDFMENGWSVKAMIRRIVLSRTYQMSSAFNEHNYEVDPDNLSIWRMNPRRLSAEALRDAMLAASGQLSREPGKASKVAQYSGSQGLGRGVSESDFDINTPHRSVYLPIVRNAVPNSLAVFDFAEPSIIVGQRPITTVPAQALYMMNNRYVIEQSDHLATRLLADEKRDMADRVALGYQWVLSRDPSPSERQRALTYLQSTVDKLKALKSEKIPNPEVAALSGFCQALFATGEFRYLE